jgi:delta 1-pyrroline-5-carboxylate dehydrogenase
VSNTGPESSVPTAASGGGGAGLRPAGADTGQEFETRLLIWGERVSGDGDALAVENPYTEAEIASVPLPSQEQIDAAIAAAREAARAWGQTPAIERCELLHGSPPECETERTSSRS